MTEKEKFISNKMRILVKEGYSKAQAAAISYNMFEKEEQTAQQGTMFNQTIPQQNFTAPNINQLPNQGYDFSYNGFNPQPIQNNTQFGQNQFSNYSIPEQPIQPVQSFQSYNQSQNQQEVANEQNKAASPYTTNSVNIMNPYGGISMDYALNFAGEGFGSGNYGQAALGTGTALLKGARNFLTGYSTGKENKRVAQEYDDKRFARTVNYAPAQQGGVKNSDIIAQNAITDQGENTNINLEGKEFVMRNNGQVQPVVGNKHIENGKKADGVNANLEDGDKVLSNYVKLKPADIKELKERYDISLKRGTTFAEAQKKLDQKLGIKKLEDEKADILEKIEKATKIKDDSSKQLSLEVLSKKTGDVNEKLNTLSGVRANNFEFLFERQEKQPKLGNKGELFDKNGKEVTESNEDVAQQGLQYATKDQSYGAQRVSNVLNSGTSDDNMGINLRKIKSIQSGVSNDKLGDGYYIYYDKLPTEAGFDPNRNREFVTQEAYTNTVLRAPAYQEYMRNLSAPTNDQRIVTEEFQQGGVIELAKKYDISPDRASELMAMQQGGTQEQEVIQEQDPMQQVFQAVAQMMQQGLQEEQIAQQLVKMGVPEQEIGQVIQEVAQQMQGQTQNEVSQEQTDMEVAQQGGEKEYYQQAGTYTKKDQEERLDDFYNMSSGLGYDGKKEIGAMQNWMAANYPDEVVNYFTKNGQPLTAKHVDIIKNRYKDIFKETDISANKKSEDYTAEEKLKLQTALGDKANKEFLLEGFKDNKWDWRFPMVAQNPNQPVQGAVSPQIAAPSMARFTLPEDPQVTPQANTQTVENPQKEIQPNGVRNIMPNFGSYIPLFSPMSPLSKETVAFSRAEPIKVTPESMLAEQENKRQSDIVRIEQSGLSPQQQAAVLGQGLASSQLASNDAISKVEAFNANNAWQTDNMNNATSAKEQIMNAQFRQNYADKAMQTLANNEESLRNDYRSNFLQNQMNSNKIIDMNTANALNNQFAITPQGVVPLNNKTFEFQPDFKQFEAIRNMSPEEYNVYKKMMGAKGIKV